MKHLMLYENFTNESSDDITEDEILFHGTSLKQYNKIKKSNYEVQDFYFGNDSENISIHYAEQQSLKDDSEPVIMAVQASLLEGVLKDDTHSDILNDENTRQIGQYIFNGNIKKSINIVHNVHNKNIYDDYKTIETN